MVSRRCQQKTNSKPFLEVPCLIMTCSVGASFFVVCLFFFFPWFLFVWSIFLPFYVLLIFFFVYPLGLLYMYVCMLTSVPFCRFFSLCLSCNIFMCLFLLKLIFILYFIITPYISVHFLIRDKKDVDLDRIRSWEEVGVQQG